MRDTYILDLAYPGRAGFDPIFEPYDSADRDENACDEILYKLLGGEFDGKADDSERGRQNLEIEVKDVIDT